MANYGYTSTGFEYPSLQEVRQLLIADYTQRFGPIDYGPHSVFGNLIGIAAEREALIWEALAAIFRGLDPRTAVGWQLDALGLVTGLHRLPAQRTVILVSIETLEKLDAGTLIIDDQQRMYALLQDVPGSGNEVEVHAQAVTAGAVNPIIAENEEMQYNSDHPDAEPPKLLGVVSVGSGPETDAELRKRIMDPRVSSAFATVPAIQNRLALEVEDVVSVHVIQAFDPEELVNPAPIEKGQIDIVVQGGDNQAVADKIFELAGSGINTVTHNSTVIRGVQDDAGFTRQVGFMRPHEVKFYFQIGLMTPLPPGINQGEVARAVVAKATELFGLGSKVRVNALYCVLSELGVDAVMMLRTDADGYNWFISKQLLPREMPLFNVSRVEVT